MKFYRVVAVYIVNKSGQVLMLNHKTMGVWLPPGGKVEENEFNHDTAIREIREETGLEIEFIYDRIEFEYISDGTGRLDQIAELPPQPMFIEVERNKERVHEDHVYLAKALDDKIKNNEGHEIGWFEFDDAVKLDTFEHVKKHLRYIQKKLGIG